MGDHPDYKTICYMALDPATDKLKGLTIVQCRHCYSTQPCDGDPKKFPHKITCDLGGELKKGVKLDVQTIGSGRTELPAKSREKAERSRVAVGTDAGGISPGR